MDVKSLQAKRDELFLKPSSSMVNGTVVIGLAGAALLAYGLFEGMAPRVWSALLLNVFFFYSIALGGIAFSGMQDVVGAVWGRPIKRLHESFASFIPVGTVFFLVFLACLWFDIFQARDVFPWMKNPAMVEHFPGKNVWLQPWFLVLRDVFAVLVVYALSAWQLSRSTLRDKFFLKSGDCAETTQRALLARDQLRYWSAPILFCYAMCYSLLGFDLLMSLAPTWFSTLWGGWLFSIMMQTLMASILLFLFILKGTSIGSAYGQQQFHDIGKMMHGFSIFFAYLTYAHILTYWYGNVPEETEYFIERLVGPWFWIVCIAPLFNFVIPLYVLLFKAAKWTGIVAVPLALMILIAQWFVYVLVVIPSIDGHHWTASYLDVGGLALILGLFLGSVIYFGRNNVMVGIADPLLPESYELGH